MHASEVTPEVTRQANELYWSSKRSVNQIADDLDLSKGALYGIIAPEPAGVGCPLCGDQVGYPNRTAKERSLVDCSTCDWDGGIDETVTFFEGAEEEVEPRRARGRDVRDGSMPSARANGSPLADADEDDPDASPVATTPPPPLLTPRLNTVAGGALLGAAVGLALVLWARRR